MTSWTTSNWETRLRCWTGCCRTWTSDGTGVEPWNCDERLSSRMVVGATMYADGGAGTGQVAEKDERVLFYLFNHTIKRLAWNGGLRGLRGCRLAPMKLPVLTSTLNSRKCRCVNDAASTDRDRWASWPCLLTPTGSAAKTKSALLPQDDRCSLPQTIKRGN